MLCVLFTWLYLVWHISRKCVSIYHSNKVSLLTNMTWLIWYFFRKCSPWHWNTISMWHCIKPPGKSTFINFLLAPLCRALSFWSGSMSLEFGFCVRKILEWTSCIYWWNLLHKHHHILSTYPGNVLGKRRTQRTANMLIKKYHDQQYTCSSCIMN